MSNKTPHNPMKGKPGFIGASGSGFITRADDVVKASPVSVELVERDGVTIEVYAPLYADGYGAEMECEGCGEQGL